MAVITSKATIDAGSLGRLPVKEGTEVNFGNPKREPIMGDSGMLGHTEKNEQAPYIKTTLVDTVDTDKEGLKNFVGENVLLTTNNGQQFVLMDAFVADPLALSINDGTMEVMFYGSELIEQ